MKKSKLRAVLCLVLALAVVFPQSLVYAAAPVEYDAERLAAAEAVMQSGRPSGLVGFEGDYTLSETNEPMSVIVELESQPAELVKSVNEAVGRSVSIFAEMGLKKEAAKDKNELKDALDELAGESGYTVTAEYTDALNGYAVTVPQSIVDDIAELDCVYAVYPNETLQIEDNENGSAASGQGGAGGSGSIGMADSRAYFNMEELHEQGYTGEGVTVGVLDTGIDYNHPDFEGVFSATKPNGRISPEELKDGLFYGRNYINNGNGANDPMDDQGHGSHVSGTIAGQGLNGGGKSTFGIAPDVKLAMYKVINSQNSCQTADVVKGMEDAVNDGCEILSMSLGWSSATGADHATNLALNSLALQNEGVLFVLCAGNNGSASYTLWAPSTSPLALSVANAIIPSENRLLTVSVGDNTGKLRLIRDDWSSSVTVGGDITVDITVDNLNGKMVLLPTVDGTKLGTGTQEEFDAFFEDKIPDDYDGVMFVVERGQNFDDTVARLNALGIKGAITVINTEARQNDFESISWYQGPYNNYMPVFTIQYSDGAELIKGLEMGTILDYDFTAAEDLPTIYAGDSGIYPNSTTSRGPVSDVYDIKPDITAPGTAVISTVFKDYNGKADNYDNAYAAMTGTSMATPHVSAFAALIKQKNPDLTALQIKSIIVNTADTTPIEEGISHLALGAGMIDPRAALEAAENSVVYMTAQNSHAYTSGDSDLVENSVATPTISFEPVVKGNSANKTIEVTVTNKDDSAHTYSISVDAVQAFGESERADASHASFSADENSVTVQPNGTATFNLTVNVSDQAVCGSYETTVRLKEGGTELVSPAGVYVYEEKVFDPVNTDYVYIQNSVMSSGEHMQLKDYNTYGSDRTIFQFRFNNKITTWQPLLYTEDGQLVGRIDGWYKDDWQYWDWYYYNTIGTTWFYEGTLSDDGVFNDTSGKMAIPEGIYKIKLLLKGQEADKQEGNVIIDIGYFCVDNTLPEITKSNVAGGVWKGEISGNELIYRGKIYDDFTAKMQEKGIQSETNIRVFGKETDQADNVLVALYDGKYYRAEVAADGSFTLRLPKAADGQTVKFYYGDHFLPQGSERANSNFKEGFDPENLSYKVEKYDESVLFMNNYAYRAANMSTADIKLGSYAADDDDDYEIPDIIKSSVKGNGDGTYDVKITVNGVEKQTEKLQTVTIETEGFTDNAAVCYYDGSQWKGIPMSIVKDGKAVFMTDRSMTVKVMEPSEIFADMKGHWAEKELTFALSHGILTGMGDGTMSPDAYLTRGMFVTMLYRAAFEPVAPNAPFSDVPYLSYYNKAADWAYENGISNGRGDGTFGGEENITRQDIAVMLYRFADCMGVTVSGKASINGYYDSAEVSSYAETAVKWAVYNGIISGRDGNLLAPKATATRAEAAAMCQRFIELALAK